MSVSFLIFLCLIVRIFLSLVFSRQVEDRGMRGLFGQEGFGPLSAVRPHVRLRKLRRSHEEMRAVQIYHRAGEADLPSTR